MLCEQSRFTPGTLAYLERRRAYNRKCYEKHREIYVESRRIKREANREEYRRKGREYSRVHSPYRRARMKGVSGYNFGRDKILVRDSGLCRYCGTILDRYNWHLDHVIPLSRGGPHVEWNVVASCPPCNLRKAAKVPELNGLPAVKCRLFYLNRITDVSGISGVGRVAGGVVFANGKVVLGWETPTPSIEIMESVADLEKIHGHQGSTEIVFEDEQ